MTQTFPIDLNYNRSLINETNLYYEASETLWQGSALSTTAVVAGAENAFGNGVIVNPGRIVTVHSITLTANGPCTIRLKVDATFTSGWTTWLTANPPYDLVREAVFGTNGGSVTWQFPKGYKVYENSSIAFVYISDDTTAKKCTYHVSGLELTSDFNYNAPKKIVVIGDSTTWYPMGLDAQSRSYMGKNLWSFRLVEELRKTDKIDVRLVNRGFGGGKAIDAYYGLEQGRFNGVLDYDLLIISFGHNDSVIASAVPEDRFKESLNAWLQKNKRINNNPIIFLGPTTTDSTDRAANTATYRQYVKDVATDPVLGGIANKVYYYDQSFAYGLGSTASTDVNFRDAERISGSRLHPSGIGHDLIFKNTNGDVNNGINSGSISGIYGIVKKYKLI